MPHLEAASTCLDRVQGGQCAHVREATIGGLQAPREIAAGLVGLPPGSAWRDGETAWVSATAGRTPRVHARAPSSSFSPAAPQSTCCCLFLLASNGLSRRLMASAVGMTCRGATQQESATAAGNKTLLVRPPSGTSLRAPSPGSSCCLFLPAMPHLKAASTGFKVGSVSMCVQRGSVDCRPHGRSREPGGCRCPGMSRNIPGYPPERT